MHPFLSVSPLVVPSWCDVPMWSGVFLCGCIVLWWRCVFLFSSCSVLGRHLWSLFGGFLLCLFQRRLRFSKSYPTAGHSSGIPHPFGLHLPVLFLQWGDVCGGCGVFSAAPVFSLSLALPTAPAVLRSSPYHRLSFGVSASACPTAALVA